MTARNDPTSSAYRTGSTAKEAAEWGSVLPARGFFFLQHILCIGFGCCWWDTGDMALFNFALNVKNIIKEDLVDWLMR